MSKALPNMSKALEALLNGLDTSSLCDINKSMRVMSSAIRPVNPLSCRILGRARTVSVLDDFLTIIKALDQAEPGDVLVIDGQGGKLALLGEIFSSEAKRKGLSGIIVDGACRDVASIRTISFPVFCRSVTPMAGTCKRMFALDSEITCADVRVRPGEIIFADDDGIIVASQSELTAIAQEAHALQLKEAQILNSIKGGQSLIAMTNLRQHVKAIESGKQSRLTFR